MEKMNEREHLLEVLEKSYEESKSGRKYHHAQEVIAKLHPKGELAYYESELFQWLNQAKKPAMIIGFLNDECITEITIEVIIIFAYLVVGMSFLRLTVFLNIATKIQ